MNLTALQQMKLKLSNASKEGTLRKLQTENSLSDFSSNDYLGFARSPHLRHMITEEQIKYPKALLGATGSRLLSGHTQYAKDLEDQLARFHQVESGLIFNSGYNANLSLFSSLPQRGDTILHDEYIHASTIDGARLSFAFRHKFRHNDLEDLERLILLSTGTVYVAVESVYSMDGDLADLMNIAEICQLYGAHLIVDEAHAFGVLGTGLVDLLSLHSVVFARVITFGKSLGLHGAIILGPEILKDFLINFARPFIYSTAPPFSHLLAIKMGYKYLQRHPEFAVILQQKSSLFKNNLPPQAQLKSTINPTALQCIFLNDNQEVMHYSKALQAEGFDVRAIRSPTVAKGTERLRICMHVHNTDTEILALCEHLNFLSQK